MPTDFPAAKPVSAVGRQSGLAFKLGLIAALVALNAIVLAFGVLSLMASRERTVEQVRNTTGNFGNLLKENIADSARGIDLALQNIADILEHHAIDGQMSDQRVEDLLSTHSQRHPEVEALRVTDRNGLVLWGDPNRGSKPHSYADRAFFQQQKANPGIGLIVTEPIQARLAKKWVVVFTRSYRNPDGSFAGVIRAGVPVSHYTSLISRLDLGPHGSVVIRHENYALVTRHPPADGPGGETGNKKTSPEFRALLESGVGSGAFHTAKAPDGYARTYAFRRIDHTPMVVNVGMAPEDYLGGWYREVRNTVLLLGAFLVFSMAAAWLILRYWRQNQRVIDALAASESRFRVVSSMTSDLVYSCRHNPTGEFRFDWIGGDTMPLFGYASDDLLARGCWCEFVIAEDQDLFVRSIAKLGLGESSNAVMRIRRGDAELRYILSVAKVVTDPETSSTGLLGSLRDITDSKQAEERLRQSELSFRSLFDSLQEAVYVQDVGGVFLSVNSGAARMYGRTPDWFVGKSPMEISSPGLNDPHALTTAHKQALEGSNPAFEFFGLKADGTVFPQEVHLSRGVWFGQDVVFAVATDITERKAHQQELEHIAHYDTLTGLPNRMLLADRIRLAMAHSKRTGEVLAICLMDLDGFKPVNDALGHKVGDAVLQEIARRLQESIRAEDTAARIGGDEFVLLMGGFKTADQSQLALRRLLDSIALPFAYGSNSIRVSGSLGVTFYQGDGLDADQLLRHADQAMYVAKEKGKNRYHIFETAVELRLRANQSLYKRIESALDRGQFCLYYQPKVDCRSGQVAGFEALIRWNHPTLGLRGPAEFIPLIEQDDLIIRLGEWVIAEALRQMAEWRAEGLDLPVSVNVTVRQFVHESFGPRLADLLGRYPPELAGKLEIELVETAALEDINAVSKVMAEQRNDGIRFSLDDFGTGYSSLVHLKRLSVDELKIDQTFVRDMLDDPGDLAIVQGVIGLASAFHHQVVAEGVETTEQILMLLELGCDRMQGYALSRPMPADKVLPWMRAFQADPRWRIASKQFPSRGDFELLLMEVAHRHWFERLRDSTPACQDCPPIDFDSCRFSQWCLDVGNKRYGHLAEYRALDPPHREVHRLAEQLAAAYQSEDNHAVDEARRALEQASNDLLERMHNLRLSLASWNTPSTLLPYKELLS